MIEKDIITALKNPPRDSEESYNKTKIVAIIIILCLIPLRIWLGTEISAKIFLVFSMAIIFFCLDILYFQLFVKKSGSKKFL